MNINIKRGWVLLLLGITISTGYPALPNENQRIVPIHIQEQNRFYVFPTVPNQQNSGSPAAAVPEPSSILLVALGSLGFLALSLRKRLR